MAPGRIGEAARNARAAPSAYRGTSVTWNSSFPDPSPMTSTPRIAPTSCRSPRHSIASVSPGTAPRSHMPTGSTNASVSYGRNASDAAPSDRIVSVSPSHDASIGTVRHTGAGRRRLTPSNRDACRDGSADAAALSAFASGPFTMLASGVGEATGIGLVEVFDADSLDADTVLANISTRAEVGTGENIVIAGFVIDGNGPVRVLVRGVGRELERISGGTLSTGELLQDPRLSLVNASGQIVATVDDWATQPEADLLAAAAQQVGAFALLDDDKSAVMMAWLRPGIYTALLSGVGGGTGIALVEVYHVFDEN